LHEYRNPAIFESHKQEITRFLESLITDPIVGVFVMRDHRGPLATASPGGAAPGPGPPPGQGQGVGRAASQDNANPDGGAGGNPSRQGSGSGSGSAARKYIPTLFPLLMWCEDRLEVKVNNWTAVFPDAGSTQNQSKKELKTFYEIEVKLRKSNAPHGSDSSMSDDCDVDCVWTLRKRYRCDLCRLRC
jgi:hypothetical protein